MAVDYDARRADAAGGSDEALPELLPGAAPRTRELDLDESDTLEPFELPGADLSGEQLSVSVVPVQEDEFTCTVCFLVQHRSRLARSGLSGPICRDCFG
ncbi:DUF4193 domain-containing protein [Mycobacterium aquaticum]|uniref:dUTPase n=1 Tax=Mycobacterium aquaticum TaxID=1927124 RepID=A0A1X0B4I9_9MYCO|nr:DUF4193 domain-containing protein [Mycobacterium aquaticum]ORA37129.1 dUTPase [Mycobacterium aquaticum]